MGGPCAGSGVANVTEVFRQWYSGDGVTWAVREGCDQYTLTREQLAQKAAKRRLVVPGTLRVQFRVLAPNPIVSQLRSPAALQACVSR